MPHLRADLILTNGTLLTLDEAIPHATAIAVRGDRILAVGDASLRELADGRTEIIDLNGRTVVPGFTDGHIHFTWWALRRREVDLSAATSPEAAAERVAERATQTPPGEWITGGGFDRNRWPGSQWPSRELLDKAAPHHPVALHSKDYHSIWVNSVALARAGITRETPDPDGGVIWRNPDSGEPIGILSEAAVELIERAIPRPTPAQAAEAIAEAQPAAWAAGLTGIHEISDTPELTAFRAFQTLRAQGRLGLRVLQYIPAERLDTFVEAGIRSGFGDEWIRIGGVKFFMDGALGSRTALMLEPYEGEPTNVGVACIDPEELAEHALRASRAGLSLAVHAIGDRANREVLNVLELVREDERRDGRPPLRHRIEHLQLLHPDDLPRLARLNVIASMQPIHAISDMEMAQRFWGSRCRLAYAWRSVLDTGTPIAFGSDAPVDPFDVMAGLRAAVTRRQENGDPGPEGWYPEQRITALEALRAYTVGCAIASGEEWLKGTLMPGKLADMVVLSGNPVNSGPDALREITVDGTIVGGKVVYWRRP